MYHLSVQAVDERMINVHYYYYYCYCILRRCTDSEVAFSPKNAYNTPLFVSIPRLKPRGLPNVVQDGIGCVT